MQQKPDLPFSNAGLDKPVTTEDGSELRTLHEAATFLESHAPHRRSIPFDAARLSLERAAETGHASDIVVARRMVDIALQEIRLHRPKRADYSPGLPQPIRLESRALVTVADAMKYLAMLGADAWQHDDYQQVQDALVVALDHAERSRCRARRRYGLEAPAHSPLDMKRSSVVPSHAVGQRCAISELAAPVDGYLFGGTP